MTGSALGDRGGGYLSPSFSTVTLTNKHTSKTLMIVYWFPLKGAISGHLWQQWRFLLSSPDYHRWFFWSSLWQRLTGVSGQRPFFDATLPFVAGNKSRCGWQRWKGTGENSASWDTGTTSHNSVERRQPVCQREHRRGPLEGVNEGHASQGETQQQRHIS